MKKLNIKSILSLSAAAILAATCLIGCQKTANEPATSLTAGGVLCLKVNPEIAINYDADGKVTGISARNDDAKKIVDAYAGYEGKTCKEVVADLVTDIGEAGYFVEEIEGESRKITIEIESGSKLPNDVFLDDVVAEVKNAVNSNDWASPIDVKGESDFGLTDYIDTDYGPDADGRTDYTDYGDKAPATTAPAVSAPAKDDDGVTDYGKTDYDDDAYAPAVTTTAATAPATQYDDTDYGPGNDGITDYDDTDYGPNNDGVTDYDDTDYGPNNDGITDYKPAVTTTAATTPAVQYDDTDYGPGNDGVTDYDDTDYGPNNDGITDYDDGKTDYDDGRTDYDDDDDGETDYDD